VIRFRAVAAASLAILLVGGCSNGGDANRLAGERLDRIEADPGFSAMPPGASLHKANRTDDCGGDEDADWGGLYTFRQYRTHGSVEDAYQFVLGRLRDSGWTIDHERTPPYRHQTFLARDFGTWTASGSVSYLTEGYVDVTGDLDEEGLC
jgi:hypothetical protein